MMLWLDLDAVAPMTVRTDGVDSLSVPTALATLSGPVGMAATGALVVGSIAVS